jgi:protein-disulfide isomerase
MPSACLVLVFAIAAAPAKPAPSPSPSPAGAVVATIAGEPVTMADVEAAEGARLFRLQAQQYQAHLQILDEVVAQRLLSREAQARGVSVDELLKQEVEAKVPPLDQADYRAFYEQNKGNFGSLPEAEALKRIEGGLRPQRLRERRAAFVAELRRRADVRILLDPPRRRVDADDDPSRGPADAPVTIVEFSDFQCPYCSRVTPVLKRLEESYPGKVRLVFRDFPLLQIHPQAAGAAEAAGCAHEQGKFWEMHDTLFAQQGRLKAEDLKQHAQAIGLDVEKYEACLQSGRRTEEWRKDLKDGEAHGVSSTPAFFINGRLVVGAQPYEEFSAAVEDELSRRGIAVPKVAKAPPETPPTDN